MTGGGDKKVLVVRTDRIGDVVLTTPLAGAIKRIYPSWRVTFLVDESLRSLIRCCPGIDDVMSTLPIGAESVGSRRFFSLIRKLRGERFDIAVLVSPTFRNALAALLAGITVRIGTRYRLWSPLFNRRVSHHRGHSEKHEVEYNFDLLEPIGIRQEDEEPCLLIPDAETEKVGIMLSESGMSPESTKLVAVHPGSGGSSATWPPDRFSSLIDGLEGKSGLVVALTGLKEEKVLIEGIVERVKRKPLRLDGRLSLVELAALYRECHVVVSNSTGPLHLAMAVGTPVVGLYCNLKACRPTRWGPYGKTPYEVLTPRDQACSPCVNGKVEGKCMSDIAASDAMESVLRLLDNSDRRKS